MVAATTFGSALIGGMRGGLSARGRFVAVAWSLVAENGVRCAAAGDLLAAGDRASSTTGCAWSPGTW